VRALLYISTVMLLLLVPDATACAARSQQPDDIRGVGQLSSVSPGLERLSPYLIQEGTVILADPDDAYYALADEIAQRESLLIARSLHEALALNPVVLLWVVSPSGLSDQVLADFGLAIRDRQSLISVGIISGSTLSKARDLWRRKFSFNDRCLSAIAREGRMTALDGKQTMERPLTKENLVTAIQNTDYLIFHGHGTRRCLRLDEDTLLETNDVPLLPPMIVSSGACQTFRLWSEESIALSFTDQGAAAYIGFVHSPTGYHLMGEPDGFPLRYTWPGFPIGHVVQLQNRGLLQGFLRFPFYLLLGDPRLSFRSEEPYDLVDDREDGSARVLSYADAPKGVIPVRITDGAQYSYVDIPTVAAAWEGDPFYDGALQIADVGDDKYLLFAHQGGDFTVRLHPEPPWYWMVADPLTDAMDHLSILYHAQGGVIPNLVGVGVPLLIVLWFLVKRRGIPQTYLPAVATGLSLTALRGIYVLVRLDKIRGIDGTFSISALALITSFLLASCGGFLFLNIRSRWRRGLAVLAATSPSWAIAAFWFGIVFLTNLLARQRFGAGLYGCGRGLMALITFALECTAVMSVLIGSLRARGWNGTDDQKSEIRIRKREAHARANGLCHEPHPLDPSGGTERPRAGQRWCHSATHGSALAGHVLEQRITLRPACAGAPGNRSEPGLGERVTGWFGRGGPFPGALDALYRRDSRHLSFHRHQRRRHSDLGGW
jgi:hypothetical protein